MDIGKIPAMVVGMIIAIIIVTVVAIPILDSLPATNYSYAENEQYSNRLIFAEDPTVEIEIIDASTREVKINDTTITYAGSFTLVSSGFGIGAASSNTNLFLFTPESNTTLATGDKISITNGAWTFTPTSGSTQSGQIDWILYPDENGTWAKFANLNAKVSADSTIYVVGGAAGVSGCAKGSVNGDFTTEWIYPAGSTMTVTLNKTPIEGGLSYNVDCVGGISNVNGSSSATGTANGYIYAPIKYKIEAQDSISTIIGIIPLLLVVSILMGAVAMVASKKI